MANLLRTSKAVKDLFDIWSFIAERDEASADRLIDDLTETCQMLAANPGSGRARDEIRKGLRSYPVDNYIVFYRALRDGIIVTRVLHGARYLPALL